MAAPTNPVSVDDNAGSLTVDGAVTIQEPLSVDDNGGSLTVDFAGGSLTNGTETAVAGTAVQVLAANTDRKILIIQNVGTATARIGVSGVTATSGIRLLKDGSLILDSPHCPTNAIFAIREGAASTTVFAIEVT